MELGLGAEPDIDFCNHLCGYHNHRIHSGGDKQPQKTKEVEQMMAMAFLAGFMVGAVVVLAAAALVCMTPREVINITKEERSRNGR